jgi:hypothetical protein
VVIVSPSLYDAIASATMIATRAMKARVSAVDIRHTA